IGAAGLLAHRVQAVSPHDISRRRVARRDWRLYLDPVRLAQHRLVRPMRLFRMAGRSCGAGRVDQDRHESSNASVLTYESERRSARRLRAGLTDLNYSARG